MLCVASASFATVIEDFEHGNVGLYSILNGTGANFSITAGSAYGGSNFGGTFGSGASPFYGNASVATNPGFTYTAQVRTNDGSGRIYFGMGASAAGMASAVFAPNTGQIIIQDNTGWGFTELTAVAAAITAGTWYQLQMNWAVNGDMTAALYDETGTSLVAQTSTVSTAYTSGGMLGLRGFANSTNDIDDVSVVPEPASVIALGVGLALLAAARRRR